MSITYKARKMVCKFPGKEKSGFFAGKVSAGTIRTNDLCAIVKNGKKNIIFK